MAELAWENGRLVLHGLGHNRVEKSIPKEPSSSAAAATWEKPRPSGTLEAVVDQATGAQLSPPAPSPDLAAWLTGPQAHRSTQTVMDALVPCTAAPRDDIADQGIGRKRPRVGEGGWVCTSQGSTAVPGAGRRGERTRVTQDTCREDDVGFTTTTATNSASPSRAEGADGGSPETENTSFGGGVGCGGGGGRRLLALDDRDSVCLSRRPQASPTPYLSPFWNKTKLIIIIYKISLFFSIMLFLFLFVIYIIYLWLVVERRMVTGYSQTKER